MGISLRTDNMTAGGPLLDDVDVKITTAEFVLYDYDGKADVEVPCLHLTLTDAEGNEHEQYFSAGKKEDFVPTDDGEGLDAVGSKTGINSSSNAGQFLTSLVNAGVDESVLDGPISGLVGTSVHVKRVSQGKSANIAGGKERFVLLAETLLDEDPTAGASKPKAGAKKTAAPVKTAAKTAGKVNGAAKSGAKAAAPKENPIDEDAAGYVVMALAEAGGSLTKVKLGQAIFKAIEKGDPNRQAIVQRVAQKDFLEGRPEWTFDGATVTAVE